MKFGSGVFVFGACVFTCGHFSTAHAGLDKAAAAEDTFFSELPVVLSASRLAQPLRDAPGSMTVIDRETIKRTGARDLADVMRWVPGFQVAQGTNTYSAPVMVYHGLWTGSATALQVLVDGRTLYSPLWFGGINLDAIPLALEDVERIEVYRGANSATFGSNALSGVINIVTTDPALARGMAVVARTGNQGVGDIYARLAGGTEDFSQRFSLSHQQDFGLKWFRDSRDTKRFDWRGDWRVSKTDEMRFMLGGVTTRLGLGIAGGIAPERNRDLSNLHLQVDWTHRLSGDDVFSLRYFHVHESLRERYSYSLGLPRSLLHPPASGMVTIPVTYDPTVDRDDVEFQHTMQLGQAKRLVWGINLRRDASRAPHMISATTVITKRLFGHYEWRVADAWLLNAGSTWESHSLSRSTFSPRLALSFHPTPRDTIRVGASRAHRTPSVAEERIRVALNDPELPAMPLPLLYGYKSDGNLKPERLDSFEIGYLGEFRNLGLTLDARLFDERMKDRIVFFSRVLPSTDCMLCPYAPGIDSGNYANVQDLRTRGLEYQLRWRAPWSAQIWFNQSFIHIKSKRMLDVPSIWADYIVSSSEHTAPKRSESLHWMQELPWGGANLTVSWSHTKEVQWYLNANAATRVDLRLAIPFKSAWGKGEIDLTGRSVTGKLREYDNGPTRPQQVTVDPRYWVTVRLEL